jgi:hypothetical protein
MEFKSQLEVPIPGSPELGSRYKRQTSEKELEEVRQRGRYVVLPPVERPPEDDWEDGDDLILKKLLY